MASRYEKSPKLKQQQPDDDDRVDAQMFRVSSQGEGLQVVRPEDLAKAREVTSDIDAASQAGFFKVGEGGRGIQAVSAKELQGENRDMISFEKIFPEIKGFDVATGTIHFQDGPPMKMDHLPGLPNCELKVEFQDARHTELRISYGEKYSLLLSRRTADGKIDMIANLGNGGRKMTNEAGNHQYLRPAIEEFKIRVYENYMNPDTHVNYMNVVTPPGTAESSQKAAITPTPEPTRPPTKKAAPGPIGQLRKWLGI